MRTLALSGMGALLLVLFFQCFPSGAPEAPLIPAPTQEPTAPPTQPTPAPSEEPATPSPSATQTPTATSEPVPMPTAEASGANIVVDPSCCQFDSPGDDSVNKVEEYVCFRNSGAQPANIQDWVLTDEYGWTYSFPAFTLKAGGVVRVRTGCGQNTTTDLYWCHEGATAIWNNDGDTVFLYDAGANIVAQSSY